MLKDRALDVLLGDELKDVVDMVLLSRDGELEAHARGGAVGFTAEGPRWVRGRESASEPGSDGVLPARRRACRRASGQRGQPVSVRLLVRRAAVRRHARAGPRGRSYTGTQLGRARRPSRRARLARPRPVARAADLRRRRRACPGPDRRARTDGGRCADARRARRRACASGRVDPGAAGRGRHQGGRRQARAPATGGRVPLGRHATRTSCTRWPTPASYRTSRGS